ncbi:MAG: AgmX/PglI C-terminal domain-containing protein [Myxococcota bacterium]
MKHLDPEQLELEARTPSTVHAEHLTQCADCRAQVKSARARQRLLRGLEPYTLSDLAFRRVEARLEEAVSSGELAPSPWRWLGWSLGAVAAVALAFVVVTLREEPAAGVVTIPQPRAVLAQAPFHPLTVLAGQGMQARLADGAWRPLDAGDVVASGEALSGDSVVLAPDADGVAWAFRASGSLSLGGAATLTLGAGEVVAQVGSRVEVLASTRRVTSSDALFSVSRVGAEVVLQVAQGEVEVIDSVSAERRRVVAPAAVRWSDGSKLADGRDETLEVVTTPAVPARPWTRFDASALVAGTVVSLDGVQLGQAPFVALVTSGRRKLGLTPPGGMLRESWTELVGGAPFVAKSVELPAVQNDGPEPDAAALERVMAELRRQRPKLASCYEKWLKANPAAEGEVTLELLVGAQGRVKRARVVEGTISAASSECLVTTAKSLVLPPLGTEATLEVPLLLRTPGR